MRWSLIKTKLICSELQHVYLLQLLLKRGKLRQGRYDKEEKGRVYGWGTGCWKERDTECFWVTWDENTNQSRHICDDIAIHLRHSHDGRETFMWVSHDVRANVAQFYFLALYSRNCRSLFANYSYLYPKLVAHCGSRKLNCDRSANGSRRVRDTCDDFAIVLRGVLSHKNFGHVQNFRKPFATPERILRTLASGSRQFWD